MPFLLILDAEGVYTLADAVDVFGDSGRRTGFLWSALFFVLP